MMAHATRERCSVANASQNAAPNGTLAAKPERFARVMRMRKSKLAWMTLRPKFTMQSIKYMTN